MIYLDNSATTYPKPREVVYAVTDALHNLSANPGRSGHRTSMKAAQKLYETRKRAADFFHLEKPENVIFTPSCTYALNTVIKGILKKGDHVIISSLEHNSVVRPLETLKEKGIINYSVAKVYEKDNDRTLNSFRENINERTRLMIVTNASNVFGLRLPIERLCALAHFYHILFCVDAAQSAGVLDIDISENGYDFVCCAGHKGLMGPMGTGLLLINNDTALDTITEGGTGSESSNLLMPSVYPDRMEPGTQNIPGICGLNAGLAFVQKVGRENIFRREMNHIRKIYNSINEIKNIETFTGFPDEDHYAPVLSFSVKGKEAESVARYLDSRYGIAVRAGLHCAPLAHRSMNTEQRGTVRVSPSYFTTDNELKALQNALYYFSKSP